MWLLRPGQPSNGHYRNAKTRRKSDASPVRPHSRDMSHHNCSNTQPCRLKSERSHRLAVASANWLRPSDCPGGSKGGRIPAKMAAAIEPGTAAFEVARSAGIHVSQSLRLQQQLCGATSAAPAFLRVVARFRQHPGGHRDRVCDRRAVRLMGPVRMQTVSRGAGE
jgi:hypothetical protein